MEVGVSQVVVRDRQPWGDGNGGLERLDRLRLPSGTGESVSIVVPRLRRLRARPDAAPVERQVIGEVFRPGVRPRCG